ncbi:Myelin proteolipid [Gossypium arboreum]|uniref:Myelin proteolipid n=1 Tax=Gossypium arboreum TaxID=29729 RepID=A0A0B0MUX8_GOSAR|nr:Myelin proteolipid [Gossypium arboreum]
MVLHWLSLSRPMPCPRHCLTLALYIHVDAMSQTWSYTDTSCSRCVSQTCLTLAYVLKLMHVPDMSYTSIHLNANAMSQKWSYTGSHNVADACPRHVLH